MNIALIGYGNVGKAFVELLIEKKADLQKKDIFLDIKYILRRDCGAKFSEKLEWSKEIDFDTIMKLKDIDLLVELTPTNKETGEPAYHYIKTALQNKIHVVTGNKGPVLLHYQELKAIAKQNKVGFGIGCTTGGALPGVNTGVFDLAGAKISKIEGILNGTTNYILTEMQTGVDYNTALREAKRLGIAETDPTNDICGFDTAIKILILANVLLEQDKRLSDVSIKGIEHIEAQAKDSETKIKLIGTAEVLEDSSVTIAVKPRKIGEKHPLYAVDGKNKGIVFTTDTLGEIAVIGGASSPKSAAAAILRDIINIKFL